MTSVSLVIEQQEVIIENLDEEGAPEVETVVVQEETVQVVLIAEQGPPGVDGAGGSGSSIYSFAQASPSTVWSIAHNLGHYPAGITVRLLSGEIVEPERNDLDINTVVLTFLTAAAGVAELV